MYRMWKLLAVLVILCVVEANIPSYIKVCKRNDPKLSACITNSVLELRPKLRDGIPELKVPPLEPLPLDEVQLRSGHSSTKIDANFTNLLVDGPSQYEVLDLKTNIGKNRFFFRINLPEIKFRGDYDIDLNILLLKYKGQGRLSGYFHNMKADVRLRGNIEKIDGKNYIQFDKFDIKLYIEKSHINLENLFAQDPVLGKAINEVVNDNSDVFLREIIPSLQDSLAEKFTSTANTITRLFTYEELFPLK